MTDPEQQTSEELVVPGIGELVDLTNEDQCIKALLALRDFELNVIDAKAMLTAAIVERMRELGTQTLVFADGQKASMRGGKQTIYDHALLEERLRELGMPEERIREIIVEEVSWKVSAREAKRAAAANEEYAAAVEESSREIERPVYISIQR